MTDLDKNRMDELNRAAFSRDATAADIEALREALSSESRDREVAAVHVEEPDEVPPGPTARRWLIPAATATAGLLVGILVGGYVGVSNSGLFSQEQVTEQSIRDQLGDLPRVETPHSFSRQDRR